MSIVRLIIRKGVNGTLPGLIHIEEITTPKVSEKATASRNCVYAPKVRVIRLNSDVIDQENI